MLVLWLFFLFMVATVSKVTIFFLWIKVPLPWPTRRTLHSWCIKTTPPVWCHWQVWTWFSLHNTGSLRCLYIFPWALNICFGCVYCRRGRVTQLGKLMVEFPLQPGLTRALLKAAELGCEDLLLPVAAMLSVENIFIRPGQHCSEFKQVGNIKYRFKLHLKVFDRNLSQLTPKWDIFSWRTSV